MKKTYSKPEISFESFQLSVSIANTCGVEVPQLRDELGFDVFITADSCEVPGKPEDYGACYHGPFESNQLYAS